MDRTEAEAEQRIRSVLAKLPNPLELRRIRVRHAAGRHFADLVVAVPSDAGVTQAHAIADDVERVVEESLPGADVVVHVEPSEQAGDLRERATAAAAGVPEVREVHNVRVMQLPDGFELSLHVKLPSELSLTESHGVVERLEGLVRGAIPELRNVHTHIEPLAGTDWARRPPRGDTTTEREAIVETVRRVTGADPVALSFRDGEDGRIAFVTITLPGEQPLPSAHRHAGEIEAAVRERCPDLGDVIVHTEPEDAVEHRG
jgi:divalent metal cation (Fe/Co/Zn/Cd) transporter